MRKNRSSSKKVAIIGAGINGLYLAWRLSEKGHKITVFEKREKIGKSTCSGLFSEKILEFIPQSRKLIQNEIDFVLIHFPERTLKINFSRKFFVMNHSELDKLVARLAEKAGAKIVLKQTVDSLPEGFDRIIGCDGANSIVRKSLGLWEPNYRLAIQGFISRVEEDKSSSSPFANARVSDNSSFVETWPVKEGFIWKIPRGKETEYGIIANPHETKNIFEDFLAKNRISLSRTTAAIVPQGFIIPKDSPDVALCGDAAGLTKPWSGGGVIWGLMAADILLKNFPDFLKYRNRLRMFFLPRIILSKIILKAVYFLGFNFPWLMPKNIRIEGDFLL